MVSLPWVLVVAIFLVGLVLGGIATRFWSVRAGPRIAPAETALASEASNVPGSDVGIEDRQEAMTEPPAGQDEDEAPAFVAAGHAGEEPPAVEADAAPDAEPMEEPPPAARRVRSSDLAAALQAHHDVLEKLEAKYRNASAAGDEEAPNGKRRRKAAGQSD